MPWLMPWFIKPMSFCHWFMDVLPSAVPACRGRQADNHTPRQAYTRAGLWPRVHCWLAGWLPGCLAGCPAARLAGLAGQGLSRCLAAWLLGCLAVGGSGRGQASNCVLPIGHLGCRQQQIWGHRASGRPPKPARRGGQPRPYPPIVFLLLAYGASARHGPLRPCAFLHRCHIPAGRRLLGAGAMPGTHNATWPKGLPERWVSMADDNLSPWALAKVWALIRCSGKSGLGLSGAQGFASANQWTPRVESSVPLPSAPPLPAVQCWTAGRTASQRHALRWAQSPLARSTRRNRLHGSNPNIVPRGGGERGRGLRKPTLLIFLSRPVVDRR